MTQEVEILVKVDSGAEEIRLALLSQASFIGVSSYVDTYYFDPLRSALKPDGDMRLQSSLRIRERDGGYFLTFKRDHFDEYGSWIFSDEEESSLGDGACVKRILENLGFRHLVTVEMEKAIFQNDAYIIAIEKVKDLGTFLEVESRLNLEDVSATRAGIRAFIETLPGSFSRPSDGGKPEQLLQRQSSRPDEGP